MPPRRRSYGVPLANGRRLDLGERTFVMGVLNVTPDSFSDGGRFTGPSAAIDAGLRMAAEGADILDIGGESTRPGAEPVTPAEELARVLPVIEALARQVDIPVSIDTYKSEVARAALEVGATLVNDITGARRDPELAAVVARWGAGLVLMHTRGNSQDMYRFADYDSVVDDVATELAESLQAVVDRGVSREAIVLDPGLGFAKRADHSLEILSRLDDAALRALDRPLLVGASRKSFLTAAVGDLAAPERDWATAAAVTAAVLAGAHIVRVHRVPEMVQAVRLADAVLRYRK